MLVIYISSISIKVNGVTTDVRAVPKTLEAKHMFDSKDKDDLVNNAGTEYSENEENIY